MSLKNPGNPYGDLELTDPRAMRALAHPVRLAILSHLQRHGPATATELSEHVDASPSVVSWHLRHLAGFGLVRDSDVGGDARKRYWEAAARGIRLELADDEEGREAGRVLGRTMMQAAAGLPQRWMDEVEPVLEPAWHREAGLANTRIRVTAEELAGISAAVEELLAPYVTRADADVPAEARGVRLLRYTLPEAGS
ncbi:MAG: helix-turn-helix domain-containing protein [Nocardioidaceae bacterium]|nr:helix-turn-helix domain-containing protein [Nocardioidaceae bacterium]NUS52417.1 helix-turn-helix domain-containing protein [Nocardioidaceae bacterium]